MSYLMEDHEELRVTNFGVERARATLSLRGEADFADIFEVRGSRRPRRGPERRAQSGEHDRLPVESA